MFTMFKTEIIDSGNSKYDIGTVVNVIIDNNDKAVLMLELNADSDGAVQCDGVPFNPSHN